MVIPDNPATTTKITVVLLDRHVAYLDRFAVDIRFKHGVAISRAELIRALVDAATASGVDLAGARDVKEMTAMLSRVWSERNAGERKPEKRTTKKR